KCTKQNTRSHISKHLPYTTLFRSDFAMEATMGDKFENIHGSTIVSRSLVEKSFNKVKSDFDEETADALKRVADEIERSKNKEAADRKSTRLNSSHEWISYAVFCMI